MKINDLFSVKDKTVIITGCSSGIGLQVAKGFILNGANVIGLSRSEPLEKLNFMYFYKCDLTKELEINSVVKKLKLKNIKINSLLNIAGISLGKFSDVYEMNKFDKTININLRAVYELIYKLKPFYVNGTSIINFSSIGGYLGFPNNPSYCASKGALLSLSKALANDFGSENIRVNCVLPGYFHTKMTSSSFVNPDEKKVRDNRNMLGRWGELTELVGVSIFLASDASSYVTGAELVVDGGWVSKGL